MLLRCSISLITLKQCHVSSLCLFNATLFVFSDEQERVQKKTFLNWINSYLRKVSYDSFDGVLVLQCSLMWLHFFRSSLVAVFAGFGTVACVLLGNISNLHADSSDSLDASACSRHSPVKSFADAHKKYVVSRPVNMCRAARGSACDVTKRDTGLCPSANCYRVWGGHRGRGHRPPPPQPPTAHRPPPTAPTPRSQ